MRELLAEKYVNEFCNALEISKEQIQDIYVNPGRSANNENYVIVVDGKSYLIRIPGSGTELFCNREREAKTYRILKPLGITDEVIYLNEKTGIKISKYYENSRIPDRSNRDELAASMATLRKLHESKIDIGYIDTLFDRAERYRSYALKADGEKYYLEGFDKYLKQTEKFKASLENSHRTICITHGDASINNLLVTQEHSYPILIDIEFPAMSDPFEDIATFCIDAEFRKKDILQMLDFYLGREATEQEQYHVLGLCAVAGMMWYSWATYKCAVSENNKLFVDFRNDYHQYVGELYGEIGM